MQIYPGSDLPPLSRSSRRRFLGTGLATALLFLGSPRLLRAQRSDLVPDPTGEPYPLIELPLPYEALEPVFDTHTMQLHYIRHHAGYVRNLNRVIASVPNPPPTVEELIADIPSLPEERQEAIRNYGGGDANHRLFWTILTRPDTSYLAPDAPLAEALARDFGSMKHFQDVFADAAGDLFGSGWAWLIVDDSGRLRVTTTPNQDSPLMRGIVEVPGKPLLGIDVWEHAYYLKYQNRRSDYIRQFWRVVDWNAVNTNYVSFPQA